MADNTVAIIGLGAMGEPMAANIARRGFPVLVNDLDTSKVALLEKLGAQSVASPEEAARLASRIIIMVETTAQVESVLLGPTGIVQTPSKGRIVAVMSTIDPDALKRMHAECGKQGITVIDAPVSGAQSRAVTGELSIFAGGSEEAFEAFRDVFAAVGTNLFHVGKIGQGMVVKLINNMLMQVNAVAVAEAAVLAVKAGLDLQVLYDAVRVSSGNSFAFELRMPRMMRRDFQPGGTFDISYKDQDLVTSFAKQLGVPLLLSNVSQQIYQIGRASGLSKLDGSALIKVYEKLAGMENATSSTP